MGAGGLREAGEEGGGGGISKRGGSREKWEQFRNIGTIFRNRKSTQRLLFLGHRSFIRNKTQTAVINIINLRIFI